MDISIDIHIHGKSVLDGTRLSDVLSRWSCIIRSRNEL